MCLKSSWSSVLLRRAAEYYFSISELNLASPPYWGVLCGISFISQRLPAISNHTHQNDRWDIVAGRMNVRLLDSIRHRRELLKLKLPFCNFKIHFHAILTVLNDAVYSHVPTLRYLYYFSFYLTTPWTVYIHKVQREVCPWTWIWKENGRTQPWGYIS